MLLRDVIRSSEQWNSGRLCSGPGLDCTSDPRDPRAEKWCILGAISKVLDVSVLEDQVFTLENVPGNVAEALGGLKCWDRNDRMHQGRKWDEFAEWRDEVDAAILEYRSNA